MGQEKNKDLRLRFLKSRISARSWSLEFKDKKPPGAGDEIAKVRSPESRLRICFHLTPEFLQDQGHDWERKISEAITKADSLFSENKDCGETVKLILRSSQPFLMEPPTPCPGSGV